MRRQKFSSRTIEDLFKEGKASIERAVMGDWRASLTPSMVYAPCCGVEIEVKVRDYDFACYQAVYAQAALCDGEPVCQLYALKTKARTGKFIVPVEDGVSLSRSIEDCVRYFPWRILPLESLRFIWNHYYLYG